MIENLLAQVDRYIADGSLWIVYFASWLIIVRLKDSKGKEYLVKPMIIISIIIFNPIVAIVLNLCLQSAYWRSLWLLQESIIIAYAFVLVLGKIERTYKVVVALFMVGVIMCAGSNVYINTGFQKAENLYKIPDEMIEICQVIKEDVNEPMVAAVDTIPIWIRQYDASIDMVYGRYGDEELRAMINDTNRNYEELHILLLERNCNTVIFRIGEISNDEIGLYGFEYLSETKNYVILKVV